jgi:hypothetical protein
VVKCFPPYSTHDLQDTIFFLRHVSAFDADMLLWKSSLYHRSVGQSILLQEVLVIQALGLEPRRTSAEKNVPKVVFGYYLWAMHRRIRWAILLRKSYIKRGRWEGLC